MRGILSDKLTDFMAAVNQAAEQAKEDGIVPTPQLARQRLAGLSTFVSNCPDIAYTGQYEFKVAEGVIPVKLYSPNPTKELPVIIYFHGGGHMCGDTQLYDPMCRKIAIATHSVVISVEYRLAPEFPYPCGLDDAEYVLKHYQQALKEVAFTDRITIAGDSAGGAICTSLVMRQAKDESIKIDQQVLIYPSVDYTMSMPSIEDNGTGYLLETARIQWYFDHYFSNNEDRKQVSPLLAELPSSPPKTLVVVAGCDPLRDEGIAYAEKLKTNGAQVEVQMFEGMIHAFMNVEDIVKEECQDLFKKIAQFLK